MMTDIISSCRCSCYSCIVEQSVKYEKAKNLKKAEQIFSEAIEFMENTLNRLKVAKHDFHSRVNPRNTKLETMQSEEKENCNVVNKVSEARQPKITKAMKKDKIAVAVFDEAEDPNKKPMYPKQLVYANGKDIQLEELRALAYWKKVENEEKNCDNIPTEPQNKTETVAISIQRCDKEVQTIVDVIEVSTQTELSNSSVMSVCTQTELPNKIPAIEKSTQTNSSSISLKEVCIQTDSSSVPVTHMSTQTENQVISSVELSIEPLQISSNPSKILVEPEKKVLENLPPDSAADKNDETLTPVQNIPTESSCDIKTKSVNIEPSKLVSETFVITRTDLPKLVDYKSSQEETNGNISLITCFSSEVEFEESITEFSTKAFKVLPSSTPFHAKNRNSLPENEPNKSKNETLTNTKPAPNLSMILELSKERFSQSTSSSKNSAVGVGSKTVVLSKNESISKASSETEATHDSTRMNLDSVKNPFDSNLIDYFLQSVKLDAHVPGYMSINSEIPNIRPLSSVKLGTEKYNISGEIGKGAYARILKVYPENKPLEVMALKHQKPACVWEWYISKEIRHRLNDKDIEQFFIHYSKIYVFKNGSLMLSDWARCGTILSLVSSLKSPKNALDRCPMSVCAHLSIQIINSIHYLHSCQIIHGDVKPDNFVLVPHPSSPTLLVKLIDYGRSIDMKLFPKNKVFHYVVNTEDFTCTEMKERKPWNYQIDLFGLAATIYLLLMGEYMKTEKRSGIWVPKRSLSRYLHPDIWAPILETLLNVPSCSDLPDLSLLKKKLEDFLDKIDKFTINSQMTSVMNIVNKK